MIQRERQVLTYHTLIYVHAHDIICKYNIYILYIYMCAYAAYVWLIRHESIQFENCSNRSPRWPESIEISLHHQLQAYQMLNLHCIGIFAYDLGISKEAGLNETPALADHNQRLLSQQKLAWTQLGSRSHWSHSHQERFTMISLAFIQFIQFNLLQKREQTWDFFWFFGHSERAGLSEYLERPLHPSLWNQSLWPKDWIQEKVAESKMIRVTAMSRSSHAEQIKVTP